MANETTNQAMAKRDDQRGTLRYALIPSPFDLMRRFTDDVDRLFMAIAGGDPLDANARAARPMAATASLATWAPAVEVTTRGDDLVIHADLPVVKPADVQVELDGDNLILRGESRADQERKDQGYWYSERSYGAFYRSIPLPPGANVENVRADFKDGVLEITLPGAARALQPQRRQIAVTNAGQQIGQAQSAPNATATPDPAQPTEQAGAGPAVSPAGSTAQH